MSPRRHSAWDFVLRIRGRAKVDFPNPPLAHHLLWSKLHIVTRIPSIVRTVIIARLIVLTPKQTRVELSDAVNSVILMLAHDRTVNSHERVR